MSGPRRRALVLAASLAATAGLGVATASTASAAPELRKGESASSGMRLVTNLPKQGAFADSSAFNSDLAFSEDHVFAGNYNGFTVYDIRNPRKPREVAQVVCPGSQNDISVVDDLLVLSVDSRRNDDSCSSRALSTSNPEDKKALEEGRYFEGLRFFDISDPAKPVYVKSVDTKCGSHTHTVVPDDDDLYVYVSSYDTNSSYARCKNTGSQSDHDIISVVKVTDGDARSAKVVAEPRLFNPGNEGGELADFPGKRYSNTRGCHDITAYPDKGLAAGACMGEGVLLDIRQPAAPTVLSTAFDRENFAFWHSATFNDAASTVVFTDELGGGGGATCGPPNAAFPQLTPERGANAYYAVGKGGSSLTKQGYFKIPREQAETENCVAHNGSLLPIEGKDVMVQAWYQGGVSVVDFTDPTKPVELAWFDRGALDDDKLVLGGSWSAYYYQGYVYSNDIQLGLDVFDIKDRRVARAKAGEFPDDYNVQSQVPLDD